MKKIIFSILFVATSILMNAQQKNVVVTQVKTAETTTIKDNGINPNSNQNNTADNKDSQIILKLENNGNGTKVLYDANEENKKENTNLTNSEIENKEPILYKSENNVVVVKSVDEQIQDLDSYIKAVESKIEWVKSNPEENKKAIDSGWFEQMAASKKAAEKKKQELLNSKK